MSRFVLGALVCAFACSPVPNPDPIVDAGTESDAGADDVDAGTPPADVPEAEPNGGTPETAVNAWDPATTRSGAIGEAGDADVFKLETIAGKVYRITLEAPADSTIDGWLTVIDSGRNGKAAGDDYVKLASSATSAGAELGFIAMGSGHYVIVRDKGGHGGATYTYTLRAEVLEAASVATQTITFPSQIEGFLPSVGGLRLYAFDATEGTGVRFDLTRKSSSGGLDARLFVFNVGEGDWIARNDNRSSTNLDPRIDAPLGAGGAQYLVVENIEEAATDLAYTLSSSLP